MAAQPMMKNKLFYHILLFLFISISLKAQRHEVGLQLGMSNLVGDIGRTNYVLQKPVLSNLSTYGVPIYAGALYRMNFNPYQTLRFNVSYSNIQFIDEYAKEQYRVDRKLWGTNSIFEADVLFEYNFLPVNDEQKSMLSPYIFGGVGGLLVNAPRLIVEHDFKRRADGSPIDPVAGDIASFDTRVDYDTGRSLTMAIPFGVGLKYKFNYNWAIFGEFLFRPTFSDSIDFSKIDDKDVKVTYNKDKLAAGSKTKSLLEESPFLEMAERKTARIIENRQVGNTNSKDWVNSVSVGLSYSFGRQPCYCD